MSADRFELPFTETMTKYHGEIERLVYAAEIACQYRHCGINCMLIRQHKCPFKIEHGIIPDECSLVRLRAIFGDHFIQHDPTEVLSKVEIRTKELMNHGMELKKAKIQANREIFRMRWPK